MTGHVEAIQAEELQSLDVLKAENERLRQQVMELEQERDEVSSRCQWMEGLLQQSTIPTCLWHGPDLVYTFANRSYLERSGKTDVVGKPIRDVFAESEVPGLIPILEQAYTSGEPQVVPEALIRLEHAQTGQIEESWHNLLYNPVRDAQGNVIGVSNFAVEVTEQVKARQELHRQAQILNQVRHYPCTFSCSANLKMMRNSKNAL